MVLGDGGAWGQLVRVGPLSVRRSRTPAKKAKTRALTARMGVILAKMPFHTGPTWNPAPSSR